MMTPTRRGCRTARSISPTASSPNDGGENRGERYFSTLKLSVSEHGLPSPLARLTWRRGDYHIHRHHWSAALLPHWGFSNSMRAAPMTTGGAVSEGLSEGIVALGGGSPSFARGIIGTIPVNARSPTGVACTVTLAGTLQFAPRGLNASLSSTETDPSAE